MGVEKSKAYSEVDEPMQIADQVVVTKHEI